MKRDTVRNSPQSPRGWVESERKTQKKDESKNERDDMFPVRTDTALCMYMWNQTRTKLLYCLLLPPMLPHRSLIASSIIVSKLSNSHEHLWTAYDAKVPHDKIVDDVLERNVGREDLWREEWKYIERILRTSMIANL